MDKSLPHLTRLSELHDMSKVVTAQIHEDIDKISSTLNSFQRDGEQLNSTVEIMVKCYAFS